jgi:TetR/AcrR family transcriptional regulator
VIEFGDEVGRATLFTSERRWHGLRNGTHFRIELMVQSPTTPGRLERRKARTRAAILEAASGLFREQGYEETAIQQIAERADTGVGTLYGYFASKEDILREVLKLHSGQAIQRYRAAVDHATPAIDRLIAALTTFADYICDNRSILQAAFQMTGDGLRGDEQPMEWLVAAYAGIVAEGVAVGQLGPVPADAAARMLLGTYLMAMLGVGIWRGRDETATRADLEELARLLVRQ